MRLRHSFEMFSKVRFAALSLGTAILLQAGAPALAEDVYKEVSPPALKAGDTIPAPTEEPVLTVKGAIGVTQNGQNVVQFDMPTLERLGVVTYTTPTNWTEGPVVFEGVLLSKLLDIVKADPNAKNLQLTAINDYQVTIPAEDASKWPVMLATKENGNYMSIREHGPLWVVYPQHVYPELGNREYLTRWVWQLAEIDVE